MLAFRDHYLLQTICRWHERCQVQNDGGSAGLEPRHVLHGKVSEELILFIEGKHEALEGRITDLGDPLVQCIHRIPELDLVLVALCLRKVVQVKLNQVELLHQHGVGLACVLRQSADALKHLVALPALAHIDIFLLGAEEIT